MLRTIIVVFVLSIVGLSTGCDKAKNEVLPNGTRIFGERILKDGTKRIERVELPNGVKKFNKTVLSDGTEKDERIEHPNGDKQFDVTFLADGTQKTERMESHDGCKSFGITLFANGTMREEREELPNGQKQFGVAALPDGTKTIERVEFPNAEKWIAVTRSPDGTQIVGRVELPNGKSLLHVARYVTASAVPEPRVSKSDPQTGLVAPKQSPEEEQEQAERTNGEPIAYLDFYIKARTGLPIGKRYHFIADIGSDPLCLHPTGYLNQSTFDTQHILCGVVPAFDNPVEHEALLRAGKIDDARVVASMGADGNVRIHKVDR